LAEQFKGKPVQFLNITDEEPGIIQRFLKDYTMAGWIGLDSKEQTFRRYGINARPQKGLVDAAGIVRAIGSPADLTGEIMENFLAGQPVVFSYSDAPGRLQMRPEAFTQMMISPAAPVDVSGYSSGARSGKPGRRWEVWGVPLRTLLYYAYD